MWMERGFLHLKTDLPIIPRYVSALQTSLNVSEDAGKERKQKNTLKNKLLIVTQG